MTSIPYIDILGIARLIHTQTIFYQLLIVEAHRVHSQAHTQVEPYIFGVKVDSFAGKIYDTKFFSTYGKMIANILGF